VLARSSAEETSHAHSPVVTCLADALYPQADRATVALLERLGHRAGADKCDQVRGVHRAPAVLGGLDELERHREPGRA
jgi:hypothetical protein